ncbi:SgrR family transcriptional regulator [Entomohabitans teleogrylli]|uniref:SgrR family transcriptional regulator n=1 Tax=Entomohabitans teleogrylli TaxID=1384589 RepID=UPI00073D5198|nr:SgrR family transcriptional regulator [Entomohabitans teleogrylli]
MRQLQKVRQYQRLLDRFGNQETHTTLSELAEILICSERHVRTLIKQLSASGWLSWQASPGRGHRARLQCQMPASSLSVSLMQVCLAKGDYQSALQLADGDPASLHHIIAPFLGGKWLQHQPTLRIPWYRSLGTPAPTLGAQRAERHLVGEIHAGLTRFMPGHPEPIADLAHHWQCDAARRRWRFFLRTGLRWQNGQGIEAEQILAALHQALVDPLRNRGTEHISDIRLSHEDCLEFRLASPDALLAQRMASPLWRLPHPALPEIGAGPFSIASHQSHYLRLEKHPWYFANHPLLHAIEFWTTSGAGARSPAFKSGHITVGQGQQNRQPETRSQPGKGFTWMMIHHRHPLPVRQALRSQLLSLFYRDLAARSDLVPVSQLLDDLAMPAFSPANEGALPTSASLACYDTAELRLLAEKMQACWRRQGRELKMYFYQRREWYQAGTLDGMDMIIGDHLAGEIPALTLEEWFTHDPAWQAVLEPDVWLKGKQHLLACSADAESYPQRIADFYRPLLHDALCTPLFHYNYQINALENVEDITLTADGWFDFSRLWLPPAPAQRSG